MSLGTGDRWTFESVCEQRVENLDACQRLNLRLDLRRRFAQLRPDTQRRPGYRGFWRHREMPQGFALLAVARKFIVLDIHETTPEHLLGLSAVTLALGATYWFVRQGNDP